MYSPLGGEQSAREFLLSVIAAVQSGDLSTLEGLREPFLDVPGNAEKCTDEAGNGLAHLAVQRGDVAVLSFVLDALGVSINAVNQHGKTPLHVAARNNDSACCRALLERGAKDDIPCSVLSTPFHTAAACGSVDCLELLLRHAPDPITRINEADKNKSTALLKSIYEGELRVVKWLIDHGADCDVKDINGMTPLLLATALGRAEIVDALLERNVDIRAQDAQGNSAIHHCAMRCLPKVCEALIVQGAPVAVVNAQRCNPLHLAAMHAQPAAPEWALLVLLLIQHGGEALLKQENGAKKRPEELVARAHRHLFSVHEVRRQKEIQSKMAQSERQRADEAAESLASAIEARRAAAAAAAAAAKEEAARCAKETEERLRHEYEIRAAAEEALEQQRLEEEAIARAKRESANKKNNKSSVGNNKASTVPAPGKADASGKSGSIGKAAASTTNAKGKEKSPAASGKKERKK